MNPFQAGRVQAVYVIHVRSFTERAAHIKAELARFEIPFEFIDQHDPDTMDPELKRRYMAADYSLPLRKFSCSMKHFEAHRRIAAEGWRRALVLEDDVILSGRFHEELSLILAEAESFDFPHSIQLGCANNMYVPASRLRPGRRLYDAREVRANEAYLIGADTAHRRVQWLERNRLSRPTDHTFSQIDEELGIRIFWTEPSIVEQGSMTGLFPTALATGKVRKPLWCIALQFRWQRFRKKHLYRLFSASSSPGATSGTRFQSANARKDVIV
jgi:glycosyl transferase family 25